MSRHHGLERKRQVEIEARRRKVAALLLSGVTNRAAIAEELGVTYRTILRDIAVIEEWWREEAVQDIAAAKGKDLQRIERLIQAVWRNALQGNAGAVKRVIELLDRRAKLLGLDEHTGTSSGEVVIRVEYADNIHRTPDPS